jgi:hypothetical protein
VIKEEINEDIYDEEGICEFMDANQISEEEAGFMEGYLAS